MKPTIQAWIENGLFELTWRADGDDMTLDVMNRTTGSAVPFSPYPDDRQWGFMPAGTYLDFFDEVMDEVPQADRANLMLEKLPASNTESFGIWINGMVWEVSSDAIVEPLDEERLSPAESGAVACMQRTETKAVVQAAISELPPHYRVLIVLREIEGRSCEEIGSIVGRSADSVRTGLYRARRLLKDKIRPYLEEVDS